MDFILSCRRAWTCPGRPPGGRAVCPFETLRSTSPFFRGLHKPHEFPDFAVTTTRTSGSRDAADLIGWRPCASPSPPQAWRQQAPLLQRRVPRMAFPSYRFPGRLVPEHDRRVARTASKKRNRKVPSDRSDAVTTSIEPSIGSVGQPPAETPGFRPRVIGTRRVATKPDSAFFSVSKKSEYLPDFDSLSSLSQW